MRENESQFFNIHDAMRMGVDMSDQDTHSDTLFIPIQLKLSKFISDL